MTDNAEGHITSHNPVRNFLQIASSDPVMYSRVRVIVHLAVYMWLKNFLHRYLLTVEL